MVIITMSLLNKKGDTGGENSVVKHAQALAYQGRVTSWEEGRQGREQFCHAQAWA